VLPVNVDEMQSRLRCAEGAAPPAFAELLAKAKAVAGPWRCSPPEGL